MPQILGYMKGLLKVLSEFWETLITSFSRAESESRGTGGEQKLADTEAGYRMLYQNSLDGIMLTDPNGDILSVNPAGCQMLGRTEEEIIREGREGLVVRNEALKEALRHREETGFFSGELTLIRGDGSRLPVELTSSIFTNERGERRTSLLFRDISDRRETERRLQQALREKQVLLSEVHHRVKNNLAIISGLLELQWAEVGDRNVRFALKDSQRRIHTMALIHEKLYQTENYSDIGFDRYVGELLDSIERTYRREELNVEMKSDIDKIDLNIDRAIPLGLMINELVSNCFKHAFEGRMRGKITVELKNEDKMLHLRVADNGKGLPEDFEIERSKSLGMKLVDTLARQLDGSLNYGRGERGSEFRVAIALVGR